MKIAAILSASALFALTSLVAAVGCSAPPPADGKSASEQKETTGDDNTDPDTTAKAGTTTKPATNTSTTTKPGTTTTTTPASAAACLTCLGATSKEGKVFTCEQSAADEAAAQKCFTDNCGSGADADACDANFDKCTAQCEGPAPTAEETAADDAKYAACIKSTPKAATYDACSIKCEDKACDDKCWSDSGCSADEKTCEDALDKCDAEVGGQ